MDFGFVFKKVISIGLTPISLTLILVVAGLILVGFSRTTSGKRPGPKWLWFKGISGDLGTSLIWGAIILLYLGSIEIVSGGLNRILEKKYPPLGQITTPPEFIVVLPGGHRYGAGKPAHSQIQRKTYVRLCQGVEYWKQFPDSTLAFSGLPSEVKPMREIALKMGVAPDKIFLETEARDTSDHPRYLKPQLAGKNFLLVTSGNHMPRAVALFEDSGLTPTPAPTDFNYAEMPFHPWKLVPQERYILETEEALHELIGIAWAAMRQQMNERGSG